MPVDVVLGLQYGDEGKGKVVDYLAKNYDYVVRFNGGNNAGHTLIVNKHRVALHALPSGILHPHTYNVIGNGCVIDPVQLAKEIEEHGGAANLRDRLFVSHAAHVILPSYIAEDQAGKERVGTTGKGIGPTYSAKMQRTSYRMEDLEEGKLSDIFSEGVISLIRPFVCDTKELLWNAERSGANILLEGAQGTLLDIDHGTYPYVTSSSTTIGSALTGTGLNHKMIRKVIGVTKAYCTRVGEGPFPTEQKNEFGDMLRNIGMEFGTTTGRPRRCGWLDVPDLRYARNLNGVDEVVVTKLDILDSFEVIPVGVMKLPRITIDDGMSYFNAQGWNTTTKGLRDASNLPENAKKYIDMIASGINAPVKYVSTSPEREDMIVL
jgi:adenylosuccinate synthase